MLTLLHPASGRVRVKGVSRSTNVVLHSWLKQQLGQMVSALPAPAVVLSREQNQAAWERWREGLSVRWLWAFLH